MANETPAGEAAQALGGMMQGETSPFPSDDGLPDHSNDIANIFGLGEEAGPVPNSSESGSDGGASPAAPTPAAEGGREQVPSPATPPTSPPAQPGQQGEPSQAPAPAQPPAAPPAAPAPTEPQTPAGGTQALEAQVQALVAQNAQLLAQMQQLQGAVQQPQNAPSGQQGQDNDPDPNMDYRFGIPDDVANAIFNEDANVARQGMAHLINSMGRVIHERVLKSVQERVLPRELSNFQQQSQLTTQQESMRQDYFKEFPQHNDPGIRLIVAQEAQTMWTLNPTQEWNQDARNALGARVNARLGAAPLQQQQVNQPAPANVVPQPAPMLGSSNRPPVPEGSGGDFISDVLSA